MTEQRQSTSDPRAKILALTPAGAQLVLETVPVVEAVDRSLFVKLGPGPESFTQSCWGEPLDTPAALPRRNQAFRTGSQTSQ